MCVVFAYCGFLLFFVFSRKDFSIALEPIIEFALYTRLAPNLREIYLPLSPKCWDFCVCVFFFQTKTKGFLIFEYL